MTTGELRIPSPIDVHCHFRDPGADAKETIASGTLAALAGGYQATFDMPNNPAPYQTWTETRLDQKIRIAKTDAHTDIGFYAGANIENPAYEEFPALVRKAAGLKLYMDYTTGNTQKHSLETVRPIIDAWVAEARTAGKTPPVLLHAREEVLYETAHYVASQSYPVHACHLSTATEARMSEDLTRHYGEYYTGGVTLHHLTMTSRNADFQQGWNGARMQPPLSHEADAEALLEAYNRGDIQILETDHAPHTLAEKLKAEAENPMGNTDPDCTTCYGVSGIEFILPIAMSLVEHRKITMERLVDSLHDQPIKMLGLKAGSLATRAHTIIDRRPYIIQRSAIVGKSTNTPYIGWTAWADVIGVQRNGQLYTAHRDQAGNARILSNGSEL